jgi:hypothetical protein
MALRQFVIGIAGMAVLAAARDGVAAPPAVKIEYGQVVNFYQMDDHDPSQSGPVTSFVAGEGMFVMYRIKKIDNNSTSGFAFHADDVISVGPSGNSNADMPNSFPFARRLGSVAVASGASVSAPGCIVKKVRASDPQTLNHTSALVDLKYTGAKMIRASGDTATSLLPQQTAWPALLTKLCGQ